jgi:hypothetical protein
MDDERYSVPDYSDEADAFEDVLEPQPFWTTRRIILTIILLITLIAFLAYSLQGLFFQPPPPRPPTNLPPMVISASSILG